MIIKAATIPEYIDQIPEDRKVVFKELLATLRTHLPEGFEECLSYGMPAFSVPHSLYPSGYQSPHRLHYLSLASIHKKSLSLFTTWACMKHLNSFRGGKKSIRSILKEN